MSYIELTQDDKVRNIKGTKQCLPKGFTSWKKYWIHETRRNWPGNCRRNGCTRSTVGGCHVHVNAFFHLTLLQCFSTHVYIIPMCNVCNSPQNTSWMNVNTGTAAVKVEEDDTSGQEGICFQKK